MNLRLPPIGFLVGGSVDCLRDVGAGGVGAVF